MPELHARYNPSGASKWAYCYGAVELEDVALQQLGWDEWPATEEAEFGTVAHTKLESCLLYDVAPESLTEDPEIIDAVQLTLDYVWRRVNEIPGCRVYVERKVDIFEPDCWGTADIILVGLNELEVIDFKFGEGVWVDIEDNDQLELYTLGVLKLLGHWGPVKTTIIQPRIPFGHHLYHQDLLALSGPIRSKVLEADYLKSRLRFFERALKHQGKPAFAPSRKTCRWCNAKGICKAATDHALQLAQVYRDGPYDLQQMEDATVTAPAELSMEERIIVLNNIELIRAQLKAIEAHSLEMALAGIQIGDMKVVEGTGGQRKYRHEDGVMARKFRNWKLKTEEYVDEKLRGPAPMEKVMKAKLKQGKLSDKQYQNFAGCITKPPGKKTLVVGSDPRPSVILTPAQMFAGAAQE